MELLNVLEIARAAGFTETGMELLERGYLCVEDSRLSDDTHEIWCALCSAGRAVHPALTMAATLRGAEPAYRAALRVRILKQLEP